MKIYPINNISYPQIQNQKSENISFGKLSNNKKENLKIAAWYINAFLLGFLGAYGIKCKMEDDKINQPKSVNKSVEHNNSVDPDTVCYQEYMLDTFNTDSKAKTTNLPNSVQVDSIINNIEKDFVTKNKNSKKDLASLKKTKTRFF